MIIYETMDIEPFNLLILPFWRQRMYFKVQRTQHKAEWNCSWNSSLTYLDFLSYQELLKPMFPLVLKWHHKYFTKVGTLFITLLYNIYCCLIVPRAFKWVYWCFVYKIQSKVSGFLRLKENFFLIRVIFTNDFKNALIVSRLLHLFFTDIAVH